jgi:hypothetical protein
MLFPIPALALTLALAGSLATDVSAPRRLEIDVELSEFTPPRRLTLDLASGDYRIVTPAGTAWPTYYPHPEDRSGTVTASRLAAIRSAFDAALRDGVGYPDCEGRKDRLQEPVISNAPVPAIMIRVGARHLIAPADWSCLTPAARRLQQLVDRNIDGVSP